jgi:hypothetical protein
MWEVKNLADILRMSAEIVRRYYMELGVGACSDVDRSYCRYFIISGDGYFGKAMVMNERRK